MDTPTPLLFEAVNKVQEIARLIKRIDQLLADGAKLIQSPSVLGVSSSESVLSGDFSKGLIDLLTAYRCNLIVEFQKEVAKIWKQLPDGEEITSWIGISEPPMWEAVKDVGYFGHIVKRLELDPSKIYFTTHEVMNALGAKLYEITALTANGKLVPQTRDQIAAIGDENIRGWHCIYSADDVLNYVTNHPNFQKWMTGIVRKLHDEIPAQPMSEPRNIAAMDAYEKEAEKSPPNMSLSQVATHLGMSESKVRWLISKGLLSATGNGCTQFTSVDVEAYRIKADQVRKQSGPITGKTKKVKAPTPLPNTRPNMHRRVSDAARHMGIHIRTVRDLMDAGELKISAGYVTGASIANCLDRMNLKTAFTTSGAASYLEVHRSTIYKLMNDGLLKSFGKEGSSHQFRYAELESYRKHYPHKVKI